MKGSCKLGLCLLAIILALPLGSAVAQDGPAGRKVLKNPKPAYPALARTMNLSGTVRLEAIVAPNGPGFGNVTPPDQFFVKAVK